MQRHRISESVYLPGWANPDRSPGLQMRYARSGDNQIELMEISAIANDLFKFGRIVTWCATHPDEVPFALHQFMKHHDKNSPEAS